MNRDCGVVGVFNALHATGNKGPSRLACEVSPADVPPLSGNKFVGYAHRKNALWLAGRGTRTPLRLDDGEWEIVSYAPLEHGFAALGLADKFNSTGAITMREWRGSGEVRLHLRDGGRFLFWSERVPSWMIVEDRMVLPLCIADSVYEYDLPKGAPCVVVLRW